MKNYVIYRHIGNLSKLNNGWVKELNFISWNNREPVYNIRTWNQDHTRKDLLQKSIENRWEAELTLYMNHREYMIIIYDDHCSLEYFDCVDFEIQGF